MHARLTDRQGFVKFVEVPYPPPHVYRVPIMAETGAFGAWSDDPPGEMIEVKVKNFHLTNVERGLAEYVER
jgi:hypothetical protein